MPRLIQTEIAALPVGCETHSELLSFHASAGWKVIPLVEKDKLPAVTNGIKEATADDQQIGKWRRIYPRCNVGGSTELKIALDFDPRNGCDVASAIAEYPKTRKHTSGRGDGGVHLIYSITPEQAEGLKTGRVLGVGVDVKTGSGSYVVLPGSIHPEGPDGNRYTQDLEPIAPAPDWLVEKVRSAPGAGERIGKSTSSKNNLGSLGGNTSLLSSLLRNPPKNKGERNIWFAKVSGHYAKQYRTQPDTYWTQLEVANRLLEYPLSDDEVLKTGRSVQKGEEVNHPDRGREGDFTRENGWLQSHNGFLSALGRETKDAEPTIIPWANFDIRVAAVRTDPKTGTKDFDVVVVLDANPETEIEFTVRGAQFGNPQSLSQLLAGYGCAVTDVVNPLHRSGTVGTRLLQYLRSLKGPELETADTLGWSDAEEGFLTSSGVITSQGLREYQVARPRPDLRASRYEYDFAEDATVARRILSEVLEYQEPETVAVFGSWWAANWAKHIIRKYTSMFPIMVLEAPSESGKTSGFFSLMMALSGSQMRAGTFTFPTLRNTLGTNYNGMVWLDDPTDTRPMHELMRDLTGSGEMTKMTLDMKSETYLLVGNLLISGEGLEIHTEKALRDRMIVIQPPSPNGRRSTRTDRSQWLDVKDTERYLDGLGGGCMLAGHFVRLVLEQLPVIEQLCLDIRTDYLDGRAGDKEFTLTIGAAILDFLVDPAANSPTNDGPYSTLLRDRARPTDSAFGRDDNELTLRVLPEFLNAQREYETRNKTAFVEDGLLYFNTKNLAQWWKERNHGRVEPRVGSENALRGQTKAIAKSNPDQVQPEVKRRIREEGSRQYYFWEFSQKLTAEIIERVEKSH